MDEDDLNNRLVAPETLDDPNRQYTKGEQQPTGCRDAWAAILFYAQFIAVVSVCVILGVPALNKHISTDQQGQQDESSTVDYGEFAGIAYLVGASAGCTFVLSGISLFVMTLCPKFLIQFSLLFSLAVSAVMMILGFMSGVFIGGFFGLVFFALSACYARIVWKRIPFAAANLNAGLTAVKSNAFLFVMAYIFPFMTWVYTCVWFVALFGVYDATGVIDENGELTEDNTVWVYFTLLLLALFWSEQVIQNTMHAIVAGVVSTWWFVPEEANHCCSRAIMASTIRATTTSFGSICFGSLLVAIIQTLRSMTENARDNRDFDCAAFLLCLVDCCLSCLQGILEYFNKFAYIYVGMYGYSYLEAGKNVWTLFKAKGWTVIVNDDLIQNTLSLFNLIVGLAVGGVGVALKAANPDWLAIVTDDSAATAVAFFFPFLVGVVVSAVMFSIVDSSVNTVIVCFAEGPAEFEANHPQLSMEMREGWRQVYPEECGF
ncbi:hypothetical protein ACHAWO_004605 [Cyclotella atomus]|uniref:Choline transporter-like protein n=1 Tax=Cyclotella atomus TaxID=382360 RepID=A0ABD3PMR3_9STRA